MIRETAIAAAFLGFFGGGFAQAAYTVCRSQLDGREYLICAPESCFPGDRSWGTTRESTPAVKAAGRSKIVGVLGQAGKTSETQWEVHAL